MSQSSIEYVAATVSNGSNDMLTYRITVIYLIYDNLEEAENPEKSRRINLNLN